MKKINKISILIIIFAFVLPFAFAGESQAGCTAEYEVNKEVEIKATPEKGWLFLKWSGACEGTETV